MSTQFIYAGIGSRETPAEVGYLLTHLLTTKTGE